MNAEDKEFIALQDTAVHSALTLAGKLNKWRNSPRATLGLKGALEDMTVMAEQLVDQIEQLYIRTTLKTKKKKAQIHRKSMLP